jgi:Tfp pilus assembly protein PilF
MRKKGDVCLFIMLLAFCAFGQSADWNGLMSKGRAEELAGDYREATECYLQAASALEQQSPRDPHLPNVLNFLAAAEAGIGAVTDAENHLRRALDLAKTQGAPDSDIATLWANLAGLYGNAGRDDEAEAMLRKALATDAAVLDENDRRTAGIENSLAQILLKKGKWQEAEDLLGRSVRALESQAARDDGLAAALNNMGVLRRHQHRNADAIAFFERSVAVLQTELGPEHPLLAPTLLNLATVYAETGCLSDAGATYRWAANIAQAHIASGYFLARQVLTVYATFLRKTGQKLEAGRIEKMAQVAEQSSCCIDRRWTLDASAFR